MQSQETKLSNGLTLIYLQNPANLYYHIDLHIHAGAKDDPIGKSGLAHVLEHSVLMQTKHLKGDLVNNYVQSLGGNISAFTSNDATFFPMKARAEDGNLFLLSDLLRQIITEPCFDEDRIRMELKVINNEYHDCLDDKNRRHAMHIIESQTSQRILPDREVIGNPDEFMNISTQDLSDFMNKHYKANTMTLYAVGPDNLETVVDVFEQTLSAIPSGGKHPIQSYDYYGGRDIRIKEDTHQNYYNLLFMQPASADIKENLIEICTVPRISNTLLWHLRHKEGCTYSPNFVTWDANDRQTIYKLSLSCRPSQTDDFINALCNYISDIHTMDDERVSVDLRNNLYNNTQYQTWTDLDCSALKYLHKQLNAPYDIQRDIRLQKEITPNDIRRKMIEIVSNLTGCIVRGPQPHIMPSFEIIQNGIDRALGKKNISKINAPTGLDRPRI